MKETGTIFSGNHPRLILDGLKTVTRRVIIPQPRGKPYWADGTTDSIRGGKIIGDAGYYDSGYSHHKYIKCPYGQVGDRLVIKETWASENQYNHLKPSEIPQTAKIYYLADGYYNPFEMGKIRSAMFMCFWMSRARPEITEVRAERLQEITEEDARAEGCTIMVGNTAGGNIGLASARYSFMLLWDSLNAKRGYGWDFNPWVFPISFRKI